MKNRSGALEGIDLYEDNKLPLEAWEARYEAEEDLKASKGLIVPFPFQLYSRSLSMTKDNAVVRRIEWNDIGLPFVLMLPLRIEVKELLYDAGKVDPVATESMHINPFFSTSKQTGRNGTPENLEVTGVPLLFNWARIESRDEDKPWRFRLFNTLWSLGPASLDFKVKDTGDGGYFFAPLLAGGVIGTTLWIDSEIFKYNEDGSVRASGGMHGPLYGSLGYLHRRDEPEEAADGTMTYESKALLLSGLLWHDYAKREVGGSAIDAFHGPLWGMIGWGNKDGDKTVRLFWIPIKVE